MKQKERNHRNYMNKMKLSNKFVMVAIALTGLALSGQAAVVPDFLGSGITLVEIDWDNASTPAGNTKLTTGTGPFALPENSGSFTSNPLWNHRSNGSGWRWAGLSTGAGGYAHVGHGYQEGLPELYDITTTHSGLAQTNYDVYAFYIDRDDQSTGGGVAAAIAGEAKVDLDSDTAGAIDLGDYEGNIGVGNGNVWKMYAYRLGTVSSTDTVAVDWGQGSVGRNVPVGLGYAINTPPDPNSDDDLDGLVYSQEIAAGTDPDDPDTDDDNLSDGDEVLLYGTNPTIADTDGDGWSDFAETAAGSNPNDPSDGPPPPPAGSPPNLLFVFPDQMRMHALGIWSESGYDNLLTTVGDPVHTPNLDQLAKEGVLFTRAHSTYPVCSPYRAMLMSGMYPNRNGVAANCKFGRNVELRHDIPALTKVLADEGYETAYVGKVHWEKNEALFDSSGTYVGSGGGSTVTTYDTYVPPGPGRHGNHFWFQNLGDSHNNAMSYANKPYLIAGKADGVKHRAYRFTPKQESDIIVDFIKNTHGERDTSKPFSMLWAPNPPHNPYAGLGDVDPDIYNTYYASKTIAELGLRDNFISSKAQGNIRYYFSNLTSVDQQFGRVLQALEESGQADNTIVVFTSDHGEFMGSHNALGKNMFYDEAFLVPLILRYPAKAAHRVEDLMIGPVDLMPTLLSMMGFKDRIPLSVQGFDYSEGIVANDYSQQRKPASAFYNKAGESGVRTSQYTYKVAADGTTELYDIENDPYQMAPLTPSAIPAADLKFLKTELGYWLKKAESEWYTQRLFPDKIIYPWGDDFNMDLVGTELRFDVPKNQTVYVESSPNLVDGTWEVVGTHVSPSWASRQSYTMNTSADPMRFYRLYLPEAETPSPSIKVELDE